MRKNRVFVFFVFVLFLFLVLFPPVYKLQQGNFVFEDSYKTLYLAKNASFEGKGGVSLFYFIASALLKFFGEILSMVAVPVLLGAVSFFLLLKILRKFDLDVFHSRIILCFLVFNPSFLYAFTVFSEYTVFVFLFILLFYLMLYGKNKSFFLLLPFLFLINGILALGVLLGLGAFVQEFPRKCVKFSRCVKKKKLIERVALFFPSLLAFFVYLYFNSSAILNFFFVVSKRAIFSITGAHYGTGFFFVLLLILGIFLKWGDNKIQPFNVLSVFLLLLSFYSTSFLFLLVPLTAYYSSVSLDFFIRRKWGFEDLRLFIFILVACGIFVSVFMHIHNEINSRPSFDERRALDFLGENSMPGDLVFSFPEDYFLIREVSKRDSLYSEDTFIYEKGKYEEFLSVLKARRVDSLEEALGKGKPAEEDRKVFFYLSKNSDWENEAERGIYFVIRNSNRFRKAYSNKDVEIWEFD